MEQARLPLSLCGAQFLLSACLSALILWLRGRRTFLLKMSHVLPLSACWTLGFILFNWSTVYMSPAMVNLIRCSEPLATVLIGWWVWKQQYSFTMLTTLIPICGGVILASSSSKRSAAVTTALSPPGIALACLSNVCFCVRPFFMKQFKRQHQPQLQKDKGGGGDGGGGGNDKDTLLFFNVTFLASLVLPLVVLVSGELRHLVNFWKHTTKSLFFLKNIFVSSFFFFCYQWIQLKIMSALSPLAFSILTPVVKAIMIGLCSWYFGDPFTIWSAVGVLATTGGGYLFSRYQKGTTKSATSASSSTTVLPTTAGTTTSTTNPIIRRRKLWSMESHDL